MKGFFPLRPFKKGSHLNMYNIMYSYDQLYTEKFHLFTQFKKFTLDIALSYQRQDNF